MPRAGLSLVFPLWWALACAGPGAVVPQAAPPHEPPRPRDFAETAAEPAPVAAEPGAALGVDPGAPPPCGRWDCSAAPGVAAPISGYESDTELYFRTAFRRENLDWSIGDGADIDVLSELDWSGVRSVGLEAGGTFDLPWRFVLPVSADYGWITAGSNRDSDFEGPGRTDEVSRSRNDAGDGSVFDASIALGYRFDPGRWGVHVTPLVGYAYARQNLVMKDGVQQIPADGPFSGNDSYRAEWQGPWVGLQLALETPQRWRVTAQAELHHIRYSGRGAWNLRDDLSGFRHSADGDGVVLRADVAWRMTRRWTIELTARWADFETDSGDDKLTFATGEVEKSPLNPVRWKSLEGVLGAKYAF